MIKDITARLLKIHQMYGHFCNVTGVVEGKENKRLRGVALNGKGDAVELRVNADGITLDMMRNDIETVLSDTYNVVRTDDHLLITPKGEKPKRKTRPRNTEQESD